MSLNLFYDWDGSNLLLGFHLYCNWDGLNLLLYLEGKNGVL